MAHFGWTLREVFGDITHVELSWMSKALKRYMALDNRELLPKRATPLDRFLANQWPEEMLEVACAYLYGHRSAAQSANYYGGKEAFLERLLDTQEHAQKKWGFGVPYYDGGGWENWEVLQRLQKYQDVPRETVGYVPLAFEKVPR